MSSPVVSRLVAVHAQAIGSALTQPDVFQRTAFIVCEIDEIAANAVRLVQRIKFARHEGNRATMQQAAADLAKIFGQGQQLAETTERVLA